MKEKEPITQNQNPTIIRRSFFRYIAEGATWIGAYNGGKFLYHATKAVDTLDQQTETLQKQGKSDQSLIAERQLDNFDKQMIKDCKEMTVWLMSGLVFWMISFVSPKKATQNSQE